MAIPHSLDLCVVLGKYFSLFLPHNLPRLNEIVRKMMNYHGHHSWFTLWLQQIDRPGALSGHQKWKWKGHGDMATTMRLL